MRRFIYFASGVLLMGLALIEFTERSPQIVFSVVVLSCSISGAIFVAIFQKSEPNVFLRMLESLPFIVAIAFSIKSLINV